MKYKDIYKEIDKKIKIRDISTNEKLIDYCNTLDTFKNFDLYCNNWLINSISINVEENRIDFKF